MNNKILNWCLYVLVMVTFLSLCGCERYERDNLKNKYSDKEIKKLTEEYIEDKYGDDDVVFGEIDTFDYKSGSFDATVMTAFKGFIVEVDDYLVYMSFDDEGDYRFSDDRQTEEIEVALQAYFEDTYGLEGYVTLNDGSTGSSEAYVEDLLKWASSFVEVFDGDVEAFFSDKKGTSQVDIYLKYSTDITEEELVSICEDFDEINMNALICEFENGVYEVLQPHFDDKEYMLRYTDDFRARNWYVRTFAEMGYSSIDSYQLAWEEITSGIFVKSSGEYIVFDDVNAAVDDLKSRHAEYKEEQLYAPSERDLMAILCLEDASLELMIDERAFLHGDYVGGVSMDYLYTTGLWYRYGGIEEPELYPIIGNGPDENGYIKCGHFSDTYIIISGE